MHYYQHHIGDFIRDTANLTNEQLAVYMKMLWIYYDKEKPLVDDCESIAFAVRSDEKTVHLLLRHFFNLQDDGWHNTRCDKEIAAYHEKSAKAQNSANARWKNANALQTQNKRNAKAPVLDANQEPITINTGTNVPEAEASTVEQLTKKELWDAGKSLLAESGVAPAQCGSFVGKLVKDYGEQIVVEAVRSAVVTQPVDPMEYLKAICMRSTGQRKSGSKASKHSGFAMMDYTQGINDDGSF